MIYFVAVYIHFFIIINASIATPNATEILYKYFLSKTNGQLMKIKQKIVIVENALKLRNRNLSYIELNLKQNKRRLKRRFKSPGLGLSGGEKKSNRAPSGNNAQNIENNLLSRFDPNKIMYYPKTKHTADSYHSTIIGRMDHTRHNPLPMQHGSDQSLSLDGYVPPLGYTVESVECNNSLNLWLGECANNIKSNEVNNFENRYYYYKFRQKPLFNYRQKKK